MSCNASSLMTNAAAQGYYGLEQRSLLMSILYMLCSGGAGGGQLVTYTSGTPADPANTGLPAIAYDPTGALPTMGWNTSTLTWN